MNQAVHQLLQLILQGLAWFLRTIEALWVWSWSQIASVFNTPWDLGLSPRDCGQKEAPARGRGSS